MRSAVENEKVENYFRYLRNWDNESKKNLIIKLTQSINLVTKKERDFSSCFGAWQDSRSADEIVEELRADRINNPDIEDF